MNENIKRKAAIAFLISALSLPVVSAVLRTLNLFLFFETEVGYYKSGAPLPIIADILLGLGVVFFTVFPFIFFKKEKLEYKKPALSQIIAAIIGSVCSAFLTVCDFSGGTRGDSLGMLSAALSLMCALYFICAVVDISPAFKVLSGIFVIARLTVMLGRSYFNQQVQMNAPDKILFGLACVFGMLFFAGELKLFVGTARTPVYLLSSAITLSLSLTSALPSVIAYHAGRLPEANGLYEEYYLLLALAIYSGVVLTRQAVGIIKANTAKEETEIQL